MKKKYLRVLSIFLAVGLLLEQPAMAYAAEVQQESAVQEQGEGTTTETSLTGEESGNTEVTPTEGEADDTETTPAEGEADDTETTPAEGEADDTETTPAEGEADDTETSPAEGENNGETAPITDSEGAVITDETQPSEEKELTEEELAEKEKLEKELAEKELDEKALKEKELETLAAEEEIVAADGTWNIQSFGAVSGTECTYAINQTLAKVTAEAPTVIFPSGNYKLVGWLKVPANARLVFEDGASLTGDGSCGGLLIEGSNVTIENAVISNVSIAIKATSGTAEIKITGGNLQPQTASGVGVNVESASNVEINGTTMTNGKFGILANTANTLKVLSCTVTDQSQGGIWFRSGSTGVTLTSNTIKRCKMAGIWCDGSTGISITSNTIEENGDAANQSTYGIKTCGSSSNITIQNNRVANNLKDGINIDQNSTGVKVLSNTVTRNKAIGIITKDSELEITGNTITQNQDHGIILITSYASAIKNNTVDGSNAVGTVTRAEQYGILIDRRNASNKSKVIEISGNTVNGVAGNGIMATGDKENPTLEGASNVNIHDNQVSNVGDNGIVVNYNSHNVQIKNNRVTNSGVNGIDVEGGSSACEVIGNTVSSSQNMGICIGAKDSGAEANVNENKVDASKSHGIHATNAATTVNMVSNTVTNHGSTNNYSIAAVTGAKYYIAGNKIIMPMSYQNSYNEYAQNAIFIKGASGVLNTLQFLPTIPKAGTNYVSGTGTPGVYVTFTLNGTDVGGVIKPNYQYDLECATIKSTDSYTITAKDNGNNTVTYTNGAVSGNTVDETKVRAFVERMYTVALNRSYDTNGCNYWVNQLVTGAKDGASVAKGFVLSQEMTERKLTNEAFVDMLYRTFFDRSPSASDTGKKFWINLLENGVTRAYVFKGFCHSQEFTNICTSYGITRGNVTLTENRDQKHDITMYVFRCYDRTLNRQPDVKGINYWTGAILNKTKTPSQVAGNFVFSQEFKNKNYSDEEFVKIMYRMFFDREYDANGLKFWLGELESGKRDRYKVFTGFANSKEFKIVLQKFGM